ncbi:MAG: hypothetical protein QOI74_3856, partial [Micromonosporaceae bacterium]|nr:hypothetical protein [Micromonosporaceae bacterium]
MTFERPRRRVNRPSSRVSTIYSAG